MVSFPDLNNVLGTRSRVLPVLLACTVLTAAAGGLSVWIAWQTWEDNQALRHENALLQTALDARLSRPAPAAPAAAQPTARPAAVPAAQSANATPTADKMSDTPGAAPGEPAPFNRHLVTSQTAPVAALPPTAPAGATPVKPAPDMASVPPPAPQPAAQAVPTPPASPKASPEPAAFVPGRFAKLALALANFSFFTRETPPPAALSAPKTAAAEPRREVRRQISNSPAPSSGTPAGDGLSAPESTVSSARPDTAARIEPVPATGQPAVQPAPPARPAPQATPSGQSKPVAPGAASRTWTFLETTDQGVCFRISGHPAISGSTKLLQGPDRYVLMLENTWKVRIPVIPEDELLRGIRAAVQPDGNTHVVFDLSHAPANCQLRQINPTTLEIRLR